jgi:hypothetical protein
MNAHGYHIARRDANEKEMVEAWRACNALWFPQPEKAGFDGLLITAAGDIYFVEVKDLRENHNKFYLTDREREASAEIKARGGRYEIVTNITQALALVGAE